jgi:hypothetical protein
MSLGNDIEKMREQHMKPDIPYDKFKETMENSPMPEYDLVKDGGLALPEFNRLKKARDYEEYKRIWRKIKEEREERRENRSPRVKKL